MFLGLISQIFRTPDMFPSLVQYKVKNDLMQRIIAEDRAFIKGCVPGLQGFLETGRTLKKLSLEGNKMYSEDLHAGEYGGFMPLF